MRLLWHINQTCKINTPLIDHLCYIPLNYIIQHAIHSLLMNKKEILTSASTWCGWACGIDVCFPCRRSSLLLEKHTFWLMRLVVKTTLLKKINGSRVTKGLVILIVLPGPFNRMLDPNLDVTQNFRTKNCICAVYRMKKYNGNAERRSVCSVPNKAEIYMSFVSSPVSDKYPACWQRTDNWTIVTNYASGRYFS